MKNSFHGPIQGPLVQILENLGASVQNFCMLYPSSKFQVSRFIHHKVLAIFKKNSFRDSIRPLAQNSENPGARVKYF